MSSEITNDIPNWTSLIVEIGIAVFAIAISVFFYRREKAGHETSQKKIDDQNKVVKEQSEIMKEMRNVINKQKIIIDEMRPTIKHQGDVIEREQTITRNNYNNYVKSIHDSFNYASEWLDELLKYREKPLENIGSIKSIPLEIRVSVSSIREDIDGAKPPPENMLELEKTLSDIERVCKSCESINSDNYQDFDFNLVNNLTGVIAEHLKYFPDPFPDWA